MAIRVRKDGIMVCAAYTQPEEGDTYIDDTLHYEMSVEHGVIVAFPADKHKKDPRWFWAGSAPNGCDIVFAEKSHAQPNGEQNAE